jgi:spore germination protein KB
MERISTHQFMTLGAAVLMGGTFLILAAEVTEASGRDGWMVVLPGFAVAIPYGLMVLSLLAQYPRKNLFQVSEILFGKWIAKIISFAFILISVYYGGLLLAICGDIFQRSVMVLSSLWVLELCVLVLVFYLAVNGIEVFARFSEVIFPIILFTLILNFALAIPNMEPGEMMPILGEGIRPLFSGMFIVMALTMEYIFFLAGLLTFLPTGKQEFSQLKTGLWRAVFLVGIVQTLGVLAQIFVFGPSETIRLTTGILVLGKMVEISRTVLGAESLFMGVWLGALVIKICALLFGTSWALETVFNLKGLKWSFITVALFFGIALAFTRGTDLILEITLIQKYVIFPFAFVWIPVLWGVARWKKGAGG